MRYLIFIFRDHLIYHSERRFLALLVPILVLLSLFIKSNLFQILSRYNHPIFWFILFGGSYLLVSVVYGMVHRVNFFVRREFWSKFLLLTFLITLEYSFRIPGFLLEMKTTGGMIFQTYMTFTIHQYSVVLTVLPGIFLFYLLFEKNNRNIYGILAPGNPLSPYYPFYLGILLVAFFSANLSSIGQFYPKFPEQVLAELSWTRKIIYILIYESGNALDIVSLEFLFRGFMVLAMIKSLGKGSVWPMAIVYMLFHAGKPFPEFLSSFFGGYLIGILCLYLRNLWPGILFHLCLNFGVEVFAWILK